MCSVLKGEVTEREQGCFSGFGMFKGSRDISNVQRSSKGQECLKDAGMFNGGMFIGFRDIYRVQGCSKSTGCLTAQG